MEKTTVALMALFFTLLGSGLFLTIAVKHIMEYAV